MLLVPLFLSTLGLGSAPFALHINLLFHFCAFLHSPLEDFIFFFLFIVAKLHACVVCIALPAGLAVVPTQGSYFAFAIFFVVFCGAFGKQACFGSEAVARD